MTNSNARAPDSLLAQIVDASEDAILSGGVDGTISSWNPAAERLFGYSAHEMIGGNSWVLIPPELHDEQKNRIGVMQRDESIRAYETVRLHKSGRRIPVSVTLFPLHDAQGKVTAGAAILRDLTAQREAEARMRTLEAENAHFARLSEMGQMSAAIAHELNQPLAAIANYLGAARNRTRNMDGDSLLVEILEKASGQTVRAGKILRVLRDFVEKRESNFGTHDVNALVRDGVALGVLGFEKTNAQVIEAPDADLPALLIDPIQIQQVIVNLVRNALEAMRDCANPVLRVSTRLLEDAVCIEISDNGPGLPAEVRDRLFQAFVTTKNHGIGIGLAICRSIMEAHGGSIQLVPGKTGATFALRLPLPAS